MQDIETLVQGAVTLQMTGRLAVATRGPGFVEITRPLSRFVGASGIGSGLATIFCRHTSASVAIQENADPDVQADLSTALDRLAPRDAGYRHDVEGSDDMPAHIRAMLTGSSLAVPILDGRLALGRWQGVYLIEHRDRPHGREVLVNLIGT